MHELGESCRSKICGRAHHGQNAITVVEFGAHDGWGKRGSAARRDAGFFRAQVRHHLEHGHLR